MVFLKITDGIEARRFQVAPGEITFQQLQEKINSFFPGAVKDSSDLTLRYRDSDGDTITISSDQEFQEVLSDLPSDYIWKLHIHSSPNEREEAASAEERKEAKSAPHRNRVSSWDHFFQCPCALRKNPREELNRQIQETLELLELFCGRDNTKAPPPEGTTKTPTSSADTTQPSSDGSNAPSTERDNEATERKESSETAPNEGSDEEVKSKHPSKKAAGSECPASHHCHVKRIHLLEPTLFGGLFGPTVFGPSVQYHITLTPKTQATAASSA